MRKALKLPELLAPAGDMERLKIALAYGADAVYLGGKIFGLRAFADNFSPAELAEGLPTLKDELRLVNPSVVATLGNTPLKAVFALTGEKPPVIGTAHGSIHTIMIEGQAFSLIPLYHPASGIYNRGLVEVMEQDAAFVGRFVQTLKS